MQPIASFATAGARAVTCVLTDIDGTLTDGGRLGAQAYAAMWRLHDAGIAVVPVTGRPAGWCDAIARQWPVAGVVGENGALAYFAEGGRLQRFYCPGVDRHDAAARLAEVEAAILAEVPGSRVAADQPFRMFDLAIDFCEDPPDLGLAAAEQIRGVFARFGARARISNIHVNGWFGDYDKLSMVRHFVARRFGGDLDADRQRYIFCGDSPNDEPMFEYFPNACAVANIAPFVTRLTHRPRFVTMANGGAGFAELVDHLLRSRQ